MNYLSAWILGKFKYYYPPEVPTNLFIKIKRLQIKELQVIRFDFSKQEYECNHHFESS